MDVTAQNNKVLIDEHLEKQKKKLDSMGLDYEIKDGNRFIIKSIPKNHIRATEMLMYWKNCPFDGWQDLKKQYEKEISENDSCSGCGKAAINSKYIRIIVKKLDDLENNVNG